MTLKNLLPLVLSLLWFPGFAVVSASAQLDQTDDHPIGSKDWQLSLFVGDEVFYDWIIDRWVRNRFFVGVTKVFNNHFTQDIYYMRQNDGVSLPGDLNAVGTTLRFRL